MNHAQKKLMPHTLEWARTYEKERPILRAAFKENLVSLHHIGGTAIPGISAWPTIDILAVVQSINEAHEAVSHMKKLGFHFQGEYETTGKLFFWKKDDSMHVHVFEEGHPDIARYLVVTEYLIIHPERAKQYEEEKKTLAAEHSHMHAYTLAKKEFMKQLDEEAGLWKEDQCD